MNFYQALDVSSLATAEEITAAYRRISSRFHPDRNPDPSANDRFQRAATAYAVLKDPQKRREYDMQLINNLVDDVSNASQEAWDAFINSILSKAKGN